MTKRLLAMLLMLGAFGCAEEVRAMREQYADDCVAGMRFRRHESTGLCFAMCGLGNNFAMTHVPCDQAGLSR